jgi:DNA replication and repair protein RecF
MFITEIHAEGFRNLEGALECAPGINILCGENAQGKTNWLEAIYILGNTKSFRTSTLREVLRINGSGENQPSGQAFLRGNVERERLVKNLQIQIEDSTKNFYVNGKRESVVRYIGNLDVVVFSADEMQIVRGEPSERRRFLDRGIVGLSPGYLKVLSEYNRVLRQKNVLLKEAQQSTNRRKFIDLIESWNEQLIDYGTRMHISRVEYTDRLRRALRSQLFSEKHIDIRYRSSLERHGLECQAGSAEHYRQLLQERLRVRLENEIASGYTLVGPHRDELEVLIDGLEVSKFGSAGEQRSALITLDLAQITVYNSVFEEYPVFLIDDIDAELDARRISLLLDYVQGKMQVFVSTSKRAVAEDYQTKAACRFIFRGRVESVPAVEALATSPAVIERVINGSMVPELSDFLNDEDNLSLTAFEASALTTPAALEEPDFNISSEELCDDPEERHKAPF